MKPSSFSQYSSQRFPTRTVYVGGVGIGGAMPIRVQSMLTTDTEDVEACFQQACALVQAGCEVIRLAAPNVAAARALGALRKRLQQAHMQVPLVADIHFLPQAAMEAVLHVDKVRVNPGNYADKKKFAVKEYSDADYQGELQRLYEAFSPLVKRCQELGKALRIGTNHGSLSDRILNRYGDTPFGMVESALEFVRIARAHGFHELVLSFKASNPKVMIAAYRLAVERMQAEGMNYPLHLGVTEAGDGLDGRIKSAIGIGTLLAEGIGDTVRVSLTEDPVAEIPVARALIRQVALSSASECCPEPSNAPSVWPRASEATEFSLDLSHIKEAARQFAQALPGPDGLNRYTFQRRLSSASEGPGPQIGAHWPVRVWVPAGVPISELAHWKPPLSGASKPLEGVLVAVGSQELNTPWPVLPNSLPPLIVELLPQSGVHTPEELAPHWLEAWANPSFHRPGALCVHPSCREEALLWRYFSQRTGLPLALDLGDCADREDASFLAALKAVDAPVGAIACSPHSPDSLNDGHSSLAAYRQLAAALFRASWAEPIWIRNGTALKQPSQPGSLNRLLAYSVLTGGLLCDGIGDVVSVETETVPENLAWAYDLLQGARARASKVELVACPGCGRTLFGLEETTQRVRARTAHLTGVTIAVMGCIVNGPGEMADADFGYVGGAPGKVNLYLGKRCVRFNVPQSEAVEALVELIKTEGKWREPSESALMAENAQAVAFTGEGA